MLTKVDIMTKGISSSKVLLCFWVGLLGACSNEQAPSQVNQASATTTNTQPVQATEQKSMPQAEISYTDLDSPSKVVFTYWSMSKTPIDYEEIASILSEKYRNEKNDFKKQEILKSLIPSIDKEISHYKGVRYFYTDLNNISFHLGEYDYQFKYFPVTSMTNQAGFNFYDAPNYNVALSNGSNFSRIPANNSNDVDILQKLAKQYKAKIRVYFEAISTEVGSTTIISKIKKLEVLDLNNNVISTINQ